jgi:hypothetical protein
VVTRSPLRCEKMMCRTMAASNILSSGIDRDGGPLVVESLSRNVRFAGSQWY